MWPKKLRKMAFSSHKFKDIKTHIKSALSSRREMSLKTKGRSYEALIRTILLYGCETAPVRVESRRRLEVFDNDCLRCLL